MLDQQKKNDVKKNPSILVWMIIIINMFFSLGFFIALNQKIDGIRRVEKMVQLRKEMQDKNTGEWKEIKAKTFIELIDELGLDKDFFLHDRHNLEGTVFYPIDEKEKSSVLVWKSSQKVFAGSWKSLISFLMNWKLRPWHYVITMDRDGNIFRTCVYED